MKDKFRLFACCIATKGVARSTISDVQRGKIYFIPNALLSILEDHPDKSIKEINACYGNQYDEIIEGYFQYLVENELGFFCDNPQNFPAINLVWDRPELITNAIIDLDKTSNYNIDKLLCGLQELGCKSIEFRIYDGFDYIKLMSLCLKFANSIFRFVSIIVKYHISFNLENMQRITRDYQRIQNLLIFDSEDEVEEDGIFFVKTKIDSSSCCGFVSYKYFTPNLELFSEAQEFNTCLNRKVSVDVNGFVRNCPAMKESFGHIDSIDIRETIQKQSFQEYWKINKKQIDICQVCEFRNVCTDCRAFTEKPDSKYGKPSKCKYNPYTTIWGEKDLEKSNYV